MSTELLFCPKCNEEKEYYTELKSNQNTARCSTCDTFLKNIPYKEPQFYIGKYKGIPLKQIEDVSYLKWALKELKLSSSMRTAVQNQIDKFEHLAK